MLYFTRWRALAIIPIAPVACLFAAPIFSPAASVEAWAQSRPEPGLDPKGGSYLLLELDSGYVRKAKLEQTRDDVRRALRDARIGYQGLATKPDGVELSIVDETRLPAALARLSELSQPLGSKGERSLEVADAGGGLVRITVPEAAMAERLDQTIEQSIHVVERRVSQLGSAAPAIQRQGANRILVQVPGLQDASRLKELLGKTAKLEIRMVDTTVTPDQAQQGNTPLGSEVLMSFASPKAPYVVKKQVVVSGADLTDAQPSFDRRSGEALVSFRLNTAGSRKFAYATAENIGQPFAIVLDNEVISAPIVREPITGGSGQISGNFTAKQANDLATLLRAGALPAPLTVIDERSKI
jgi:protein-export membrane protein SecD